MVQDINPDHFKSSYLFIQSLHVTVSEFNEGVTFFQLGVLRSIRIKKIVLDLSISEITGDINFTFVCKGFYHKSICMNSQCKGMEITNNYFTCCDIFHLTVLWKELAVVCITDGLISHNLEFESTAEPSCIALSLPHQAPLPALELRHSVHPWSSRGGLGLCILRNRCFSDFSSKSFPLTCILGMGLHFYLLFLLSRVSSWIVER